MAAGDRRPAGGRADRLSLGGAAAAGPPRATAGRPPAAGQLRPVPPDRRLPVPQDAARRGAFRRRSGRRAGRRPGAGRCPAGSGRKRPGGGLTGRASPVARNGQPGAQGGPGHGPGASGGPRRGRATPPPRAEPADRGGPGRATPWRGDAALPPVAQEAAAVPACRGDRAAGRPAYRDHQEDAGGGGPAGAETARSAGRGRASELDEGVRRPARSRNPGDAARGPPPGRAQGQPGPPPSPGDEHVMDAVALRQRAQRAAARRSGPGRGSLAPCARNPQTTGV